MALGLKGSWRETNGCRFIHRLKELKWNIKYAWQRAWRGWDDTEKFAMGYNFIERTKQILQSYRKNHMSLFNVPEEYRNEFNDRLHFNEEETNMIIDTMIYHLEMMDEDYVEKVLYGKNIYDIDYDFSNINPERTKHIYVIMEQNKQAFMKLFNLFFWNLWD